MPVERAVAGKRWWISIEKGEFRTKRETRRRGGRRSGIDRGGEVGRV